MKVGLPWQQFENDKLSEVTPLPNAKRIQYMRELIADALQKGASIMNKEGGTLIGGSESTLMVPAVLYPVTPDMKVYHEEQFGPVIPIAPYDDIETVLTFGQEGPYAQQVSLFTAEDAEMASQVIDRFSAVFGKINLNSQCGRSPDTLPFAGRRSSAMGVMSVSHALREV
jgi:glyceraldehyde-3-phosphate dehydrogenase (NADP+)